MINWAKIAESKHRAVVKLTSQRNSAKLDRKVRLASVRRQAQSSQMLVLVYQRALKSKLCKTLTFKSALELEMSHLVISEISCIWKVIWNNTQLSLVHNWARSNFKRNLSNKARQTSMNWIVSQKVTILWEWTITRKSIRCSVIDIEMWS